MFANPIIRRFYFSQFRPSLFWTFGSLYIAAVLLVLFINTSIYRFGQAYTSPAELFRGLCLQFAALEAFLLWLLCPVNCSSVVAREIADKSFDFFRMLPLSASTKTIGIVVGRNLFLLLLAAVNLGLCLALAVAGGLSGRLILQMLTVLVTSAAALNLVSLLFSVFSFSNAKNASIPMLVFVGMFAFGPIIGTITELAQRQALESRTAPFFGAEIPLLYLVSICLAYVAVWAYIGTVRRFTFEYEALFSRRGAIVFLSSFLLLLLGLFYKALYLSDGAAVFAYWLTGLAAVWTVPGFALRSFDKYLEISRRAGEAVPGRLMLGSNVVTGLILFAIWFVFGAAICLTTGWPAADFAAFALVAFSFHLVIAGLEEAYTVLLPRNEKIGYLIGFAAILYCGLPVFLNGVLEAEAFAMLSPLQIVTFRQAAAELSALANPLLLNAVLTVLLSIPIVKRYRGIIALRAGMRNAA